MVIIPYEGHDVYAKSIVVLQTAPYVMKASKYEWLKVPYPFFHIQARQGVFTPLPSGVPYSHLQLQPATQLLRQR